MNRKTWEGKHVRYFRSPRIIFWSSIYFFISREAFHIYIRIWCCSNVKNIYTYQLNICSNRWKKIIEEEKLVPYSIGGCCIFRLIPSLFYLFSLPSSSSISFLNNLILKLHRDTKIRSLLKKNQQFIWEPHFNNHVCV